MPWGFFLERQTTMADDLKKGNHVKWDTPQGETRGTVEKTLTAPTKIKGHEVKAAPDNLEYLVKSDKSDKSGKEAAHKPDELKKE